MKAPLDRCGNFVHRAACSAGHLIGKVLVCGRDWCPTCGPMRSEAHRRRYARTLVKGQQVGSLGYLVATWAEEPRAAMRTPEVLSLIACQAVAVMKSLGYKRGFLRWHWFGEPACPKCGYVRKGRRGAQFKEAGGVVVCPACGQSFAWREASPKYHPHLNICVDAGFIDVEELKAALRAGISPAPGVIHYGYADTPGLILHRLRYITRATFRASEWDTELALALVGFRNMRWWGLGVGGRPGEWDRGPAWQLSDLSSSDEEDVRALMSIFSGCCPVCDGLLTWTTDIVPLDTLVIERDLGRGFLQIRGPPAAGGEVIGP